MKILHTLSLSALIGGSALTAGDQLIKADSAQPEIISIQGIDTAPDAKGYVSSLVVELPEFVAGSYYCVSTGGAYDGPNGNRVTAIPFKTMQGLSDKGPENPEVSDRSVSNNLDLGQFLLLKLSEESYMALMPVATKDIMSAFFIRDGVLQLRSGHFGTEHVKGDIPALATAMGSTPYEATHEVWKIVLESGHVHTDWRGNKEFPEVYEYMGWCSWEHYRLDINTENMTSAFHTLEANPVAFRWFMVDDGYLTHERGRLLSYEPDVEKFPNGWHELTDLKNPEGIRWMGLWRNMMGYKGAVDKKHTIDFPEGTMTINAQGKSMVPIETQEASDVFYEKMMTETLNGGFDFAKVDFQARAVSTHTGMNNPVRSMHQNNMALEESTRKHLKGLLNCIAQAHVNVFNTKYSALTRSSKDYKKGGLNSGITYQSFANHLWLGQVVWGDLDMFHSHGEGGKQLAIARAVSGGPVYISDEPTEIDHEVLLPLCDNDGKIFRADAPAVLLPESMFNEPFRGGSAFRVIAPTPNKVAALALFNYGGGKGKTASFSAEDYQHAGEQLQPYAGKWAIPEGGLLAYEQQTKQITDLSAPHSFSMAPNEAKLFMLYPKTEGWAVIGRTDKYLSSAAVEIDSVSDKEITFTLSEYGPFAVWSEKGAPKMQGVEFTDAGNGLYFAEVPVGSQNQKCVITR